jgi:CIC family chloride channel protein
MRWSERLHKAGSSPGYPIQWSVVATLDLGLSAREQRLAIAIGVGAEIGMIFMAPLGGVILAAEIPYKQDFETKAIVPVFLASVM